MYQGVYVQDNGGVNGDDNDDEVFENKEGDEREKDKAEITSIKVSILIA